MDLSGQGFQSGLFLLVDPRVYSTIGPYRTSIDLRSLIDCWFELGESSLVRQSLPPPTSSAFSNCEFRKSVDHYGSSSQRHGPPTSTTPRPAAAAMRRAAVPHYSVHAARLYAASRCTRSYEKRGVPQREPARRATMPYLHSHPIGGRSGHPVFYGAGESCGGFARGYAASSSMRHLESVCGEA